MYFFRPRVWKEALLLAVVSPLPLTAAALAVYRFIGECFLFPSSPSGTDQISLTDQTGALIRPSQADASHSSAQIRPNQLKVGSGSEFKAHSANSAV